MPDRTRPPDDDGDDAKPPPDALLDSLDRDVWQNTPEAQQKRALEKRTSLEAALERGRTQIRLDARRAGVRVPANLVQDHGLALNLSWRFANTEMVINERGVAATLRFGGVPFRCVIPWGALWGVAGPGEDRMRVWPGDVPHELGGPPRAPDTTEPPPVEPVKPRLSVVGLAGATPTPPPVEAPPVAEPPRAAAEGPPDEPPPPEPPPDRPKAPWLRLVK